MRTAIELRLPNFPAGSLKDILERVISDLFPAGFECANDLPIRRLEIRPTRRAEYGSRVAKLFIVFDATRSTRRTFELGNYLISHFGLMQLSR